MTMINTSFDKILAYCFAIQLDRAREREGEGKRERVFKNILFILKIKNMVFIYNNKLFFKYILILFKNSFPSTF
jgi:hypothetical protein